MPCYCKNSSTQAVCGFCWDIGELMGTSRVCKCPNGIDSDDLEIRCTKCNQKVQVAQSVCATT